MDEEEPIDQGATSEDGSVKLSIKAWRKGVLVGVDAFKYALLRMDRVENLPLAMIALEAGCLKLAVALGGGDDLLQVAGRILRRIGRPQDVILLREGGRFFLLMPRTASHGANKIARCLRRACYRAESQVPIMMSLGIAVKTRPDQNLRGLLRKALDRAARDRLIFSKRTQYRIVQWLQTTLSEKSLETEGHCRRLQVLAMRTGKALHMGKEELERLLLLAGIHDIGKLVIPEEIIMKPGRLSPTEWTIMQTHCRAGWSIAMSCPELAPLAEHILSHHEWWDGTGYPRGLVGREIPFADRLLSIIDAYDSMIQGRPYKRAVTPEAALGELEGCAGTQFDPDLVRTFGAVVRHLLRLD